MADFSLFSSQPVSDFDPGSSASAGTVMDGMILWQSSQAPGLQALKSKWNEGGIEENGGGGESLFFSYWLFL